MITNVLIAESCPDGYYRNLGNCTKCICSNNIDFNATGNCNTRNGKCLKCINNTTGDNCHICADGYYGDAVNGTCMRE